MAATSRTFRANVLLSAAVAATLLSACANVKIQAPTADAVLTLPAATHVVITSSRSISNVAVAVDGNDVSNQVAYAPGSGDYVGDLALGAGMHTIVASADAYCSYCTGQQYRASDTKTFCVAGGSGLTNKTLFAQADNLGWSSTGPRTVALASDAGTETKWTLSPKGAGILSVPGTIQSRMFPCSCLRSPNDTNGAVVELAPCNSNDPRQIWDGTREQQVSGVGFYQFRNQGVGAANRGCLAEGKAADGTAGQLVQGDCSGTSNQLWKVRNNNLNQFEADQTPWGQ